MMREVSPERGDTVLALIIATDEYRCGKKRKSAREAYPAGKLNLGRQSRTIQDRRPPRGTSS